MRVWRAVCYAASGLDFPPPALHCLTPSNFSVIAGISDFILAIALDTSNKLSRHLQEDLERSKSKMTGRWETGDGKPRQSLQKLLPGYYACIT
eukprot:1162054-Pelagomonas_calceolata.AAC.10